MVLGGVFLPEIKMYRRRDALEYARRWALERNPAYYDFSEIGGDCTSFVSQCLYAGSGVMNYAPDGWYYRSINDRSPSWTGVEFLYDFLISNRTRGPFATETNRRGIMEGDVIQLGNEERFYHSLLVTGIGGGRIYVSAHSFDARNRPLDTYDARRKRYLHIEGVYV